LLDGAPLLALAALCAANQVLALLARLVDAMKVEPAETTNIPPRATRQRCRSFAALRAALNLLTFMRARFDGLGRLKHMARTAA
jgi:hypothetical protein